MNKMKTKFRVAGINELRVNMSMVTGRVGIGWKRRLLNICMEEGNIPKEWRTRLIVPVCKLHGDVHEPDTSEAEMFALKQLVKYKVEPF